MPLGTAVGTMSPNAGMADRVVSNVVDFFNPVPMFATLWA
jgi:ABC-type dipeptide/oligopeptide/nickel transport system permease subunit